MKEVLSKEDLMYCFESLQEVNNSQYIGVVVEHQDYDTPELIVNERRAFKAKRDYYNKAYNEDLTLRSENSIKIIAWFTGGLEDICDEFEEYINDNYPN